MSAPQIPIADQIACVERELRQRARVYPRLVESGRMTPNKSRQETVAMEAVLATLQGIEKEGRLI